MVLTETARPRVQYLTPLALELTKKFNPDFKVYFRTENTAVVIKSPAGRLPILIQ